MSPDEKQAIIRAVSQRGVWNAHTVRAALDELYPEKTEGGYVLGHDMAPAEIIPEQKPKRGRRGRSTPDDQPADNE